MKINLNKTIAATSVVAIAVSLAGCKGRTMENMEPAGDTVEVTVGDAAAADSTIMPEQP